jgi:hypothetical protein
VLLLWHPFAPQIHSGELELTMTTWASDSLLVLFPDGKRMLVDGAASLLRPPVAHQLDIGRRSRLYLWIAHRSLTS